MRTSLSDLVLTGVILVSSLIGSNVYAGIQVSPMNISLDIQNEYNGTISVYSNSTETQYINVSVKQITSPGTPQQKEIPVLPGDDKGLIVSPQRFILSPMGKHIVRVLPLNVPQKESIYRVYVSSVPDDADGSRADNKAQVIINVIWGALVYVEPEKSTISLSYDNNTGALINHGNRHIRVSEYGFCSSEKNCQWKPLRFSLYPEMSLNISDKEKNKGGALFIKYQEGQNIFTRKID
ncbi:fimbria/pilus periplasmic chaperone [Salmonella enterica subsp. enterica serovar Sandiego]|nr:fimbria/pilus periplasmic chaperone [Salmonella enterica subsp. enterica serovar Sandiego]